MLVYLSIFVFAVVEGEIYYATACVAASVGKLNWAAVLLAGALGGSAGDQVWYYALRGRIDRLDRFPRLARRFQAARSRVTAHQTGMLLASRFLPSLRIAIPIACAYAHVPALKFSALNLISGLAWASAIMLLITKLGPDALSMIGLHGWWAALVPAVLVVLFFVWLGRVGRPA